MGIEPDGGGQNEPLQPTSPSFARLDPRPGRIIAGKHVHGIGWSGGVRCLMIPYVGYQDGGPTW